MTLKRYPAFKGTFEDYVEIYSLIETNPIDINSRAKTAVTMGGIFYTDKYKDVYCGRFDLRIDLTKDEFKQLLK